MTGAGRVAPLRGVPPAPLRGVPPAPLRGDDPGLQPQRTALAWRRTALSTAAGSLVGGRVLAGHLGGAAWVLTAVGLLAAVLLAAAVHRRERLTGAALARDGDLSTGPGGALPAVTAAAVVVLGASALVGVLLAAA